MKNILIVGLGIGSVYKEQCELLNINYKTVDSVKLADFKSVNDVTGYYDLVIICTPNYLHKQHAEILFNNTDIFLIEKPGFKNKKEWDTFNNKCKKHNKKLYLSINNLYRNEIDELRSFYVKNKINHLSINWINSNRIPYPGSWFTNKDLSFGGVFKDLVPHLLTFYYAISDETELLYINKQQNHSLDNIENTDYGIVNKNGIFNVEDECELQFYNCNIKASWKSGFDDQSIKFICNDEIKKDYNFGLCPNYAYGNMVKTILYEKNINHDIIQNKILEVLDR